MIIILSNHFDFLIFNIICSKYLFLLCLYIMSFMFIFSKFNNNVFFKKEKKKKKRRNKNKLTFIKFAVVMFVLFLLLSLLLLPFSVPLLIIVTCFAMLLKV